MEYAKFAIVTVMMTLAAQTYGTFPALVNLVDSAVKTVLPAVESICPNDGKDKDNTDNSNNNNNNSNNGTNSTNNSNNSNPVQTLVNGVLGGTQLSNTGTSNNSSNSTVSVLFPLGHGSSQNTPDGQQIVVGGVVSPVLPLDLNQPLPSVDTVANMFDSGQINKVIQSEVDEFIGENEEGREVSANLPVDLSLTPLSGVQEVVADVVDANMPSSVNQDLGSNQDSRKSSDEQNVLGGLVNAALSVGNVADSIVDAEISSNKETNNPEVLLGAVSDTLSEVVSLASVHDVAESVINPILPTNDAANKSNILAPVVSDILSGSLSVNKNNDASILSGLQKVVSLLPGGVQNVVTEHVDMNLAPNNNTNGQKNNVSSQDITVPSANDAVTHSNKINVPSVVQSMVNGQPSPGRQNEQKNSTIGVSNMAENSTTEKTPESSLIDQTAELLKQSINTMSDTAKKNVDTMAKEAKKAATTWNDFMKGFMPKN